MGQAVGERFLRDDAGGGEVGGELQHVAQLPDIAGPVVGLEAAHRVPGEGEAAVELAGEVVQDGVGQSGDIAGALPQGRDVDGKGAQPVVEILAEPALGHIVREVRVAGGNDPHIRVQLLDPAHRADLSLLKRPKELGLEGQVHLGDLV